jgi:hypothetical protein
VGAAGRLPATLDFIAAIPMPHPSQFIVSEAWLVFKLNEAPISTRVEGDFNCVALMDAASCFILSTTFVPIGKTEPSKTAVRRLFQEAKAHKRQLPQTLFVPDDHFISIVPAEANRLAITVVRVPEDELLPFIGEARKSFSEHFGGRKLQ